MAHRPIKCPNCKIKTLIFYTGGCDANYEIKCHNNKCGAIIRIYSAGRTAICREDDGRFDAFDKMMRSNSYPKFNIT
jgi:ribosomal protein S27E